MRLRIITPDETLYEGDVTSINVKSKTDSFSILANHTPLVARLHVPTLKITDINGHVQFAILNSGTLKVLANTTIITAAYGAVAQSLEEGTARMKEIQSTIKNPDPEDDTIANLERELVRRVKEATI